MGRKTTFCLKYKNFDTYRLNNLFGSRIYIYNKTIICNQFFIATYIYDYFSSTFTATLIVYDEYKKYICAAILSCDYGTIELRYYKNEM